MKVDELYVLARSVLLDALEALDEHRDAIVLVGAQAVYLRVGEGDLAVAPFTTDADLAIERAVLSRVPPLERSLRAAGFHPETEQSVGIWVTTRPTSLGNQTNVAVDLLVPAAASSGRERRSARLEGHDPRAARIVRGLEGVVVDCDRMPLGALEGSDSRRFEIRVAGPAALLVAKVHKIAERLGSSRQSDKDALDVLRLLRGTETGDLASRFVRLLSDPRSAEAAARARALFAGQFSARAGEGVEMAVRSAGTLGNADEIERSCEALARDLLAALT